MTAELSTSDPSRPHTPSELVERRHYDQLVRLLRLPQQAVSSDTGASTTQALDAVRHLALVCGQYRTASEWFRRGYSDVRHQERALQLELRTILDTLEVSDNVARVGEAQSDVSSQSTQTAPAASSTVARSESKPESAASAKSTAIANASLAAYCLGPFQVHHGDRVVTHWPNGKGKSIFKYLVTHRKHPVSKELLMDLFWPESTPDAARNSLNVAIFGLRQAVSKCEFAPPCVLFHDGCYSLNPDVQLWVDYDVFRSHIAAAEKLEQRGHVEAASREFAIAEMLYKGDFLEDNRYEDWLVPLRQSLRDEYRRLLDWLSNYHSISCYDDGCARVCLKMLAADACDESAHRRLMQSYARQGLPHLALRQFQLCVEALGRELDVPPSAETVALVQRIRERR